MVLASEELGSHEIFLPNNSSPCGPHPQFDSLAAPLMFRIRMSA